jgi:pimeloyl-ACP methyl ester carboxylesterase
VDVDYLDSFRSFADPAGRYTERFLTPTLNGARTVATLTEPLGGRRSIGWVVCHSFGLEHVYLRTMETAFARAMAAAGFPCLRFFSRGYGDGAVVAEGVGVSSHVADTVDAVALLRRETRVATVGLAGARFGASVAAIVAARQGAEGLILWEPVVAGKRYLNGLWQQTLLSGLAREETPPTTSPALSLVGKNEPADLQGIPVNEKASEELSALDLVEEVGSFAGRALVVQISRSGEPSPEIERLLATLRRGDASATFDTVAPGAKERPFGGPAFRGSIDGTKLDTQRELQGSLIERSVRWARNSWATPSGTREDSK